MELIPRRNDQADEFILVKDTGDRFEKYIRIVSL